MTFKRQNLSVPVKVKVVYQRFNEGISDILPYGHKTWLVPVFNFKGEFVENLVISSQGTVLNTKVVTSLKKANPLEPFYRKLRPNEN